MVLAVYASLAWVLLPEGALRTGAFLVASASLISSVLVNLNPMMRFDGYLLMADALGVPNLQTRSFAMLRWRLREALFELGAPKPDQFDPIKQRVVIAYAAAIVVYRAVLYFGIALLVYHATFKLLGIALFAVEVGWFLVAPVWKEIAMWWRLKDQGIRATPTLAHSLVAWSRRYSSAVWCSRFAATVVVPAVLEPAAYARIFPTTPAMVKSVSVHRGDDGRGGSRRSSRLVSPQNERDQGAGHADQARARRGQAAASRQRGRGPRRDSLAFDTERKLLLDRLAGLERERRELVLTSPIAGVSCEISTPISIPVAGSGATRRSPSDHGASDSSVARGYIRDGVGPGPVIAGSGRHLRPGFLLLSRSRRFAWRTSATPPPRGSTSPYLSSVDGGPIRGTADAGPRQPRPDYRSVPDPLFGAEVGAPRTVTRGAVRVLDGARESIVGGMLRQVARVLVRESGF